VRVSLLMFGCCRCQLVRWCDALQVSAHDRAVLFSIRALTDGAKVAVEPVEDFFDDHVRRRNVAGIEDYMPLVFFRSAKNAKVGSFF
jgi:hypothetical protein